MHAQPSARVVDFSSFRTFGWSIHGFLMTDVFAEVFDAERLAVRAPTSLAGRASSKFRRGGRLVRAVPGRPSLDPGSGEPNRADLLFAFATDLGDLEILSATRADWSGNHRVKVLWIAELWASSLTLRHRSEFDFLRDFDLIVCSNAQAAAALAPYVQCSVVQMLPAIDVLETPWRATPAVDVLNIGRRSTAQHEAVLRWTSEHDGWYHFDTFGPPTVTQPYVHRQVTASLFSNSAVSVCNYARFDQPGVTGIQAEVGARYAESLAAGCVLAGVHPTNALFLSESGFGGLHGVQPLALSGEISTDEVDRIVRLGHNPLVRSELRRRACHHHDWGHRIAEIVELLDIEPPKRLTERLRLLADRAP